MTGKELVLAAIRGDLVERVPWTPFCGVHSASLIGVDATEYLKSSDLMVRGLDEAIRRYRPDGFPIIFDLQLEAEIFGCALRWSEHNPPAVHSHPLTDGTKKLEDLVIPTEMDGRIPLVIETLKVLRKRHPDLAIYGPVTGPYTLALHLLGTEIFMGMYDDPDYIKRVLAFCQKTCTAMSEILIRYGCDIVAVVDPMTSQIGPEQFAEFCTPFTRPVFERIRELGARSSFFVCGHAQGNIKVMRDCLPDNISIDENIPLDYVKELCLAKGISFGGNMRLTTVMLLGKPEDNMLNALECMDIGGLQGFILAPGCDMPFATPSANVEAIADIVHDPYKREVARELAGREGAACSILDLSDYGQADKVMIDVITLDSEACAPCQYMVEAVKDIVSIFGELLVWREHKIKTPEAITMMSSLFVRNIPTICIDGQIQFVSRIPPREELIAAVQKRIAEKLNLKLRMNRGKILLLGTPADHGYAEMRENVAMAMKELGTAVEYIEISDLEKIRSYGVFNAPAVVVEKFTVKSAGKVVSKEILKEWIKALND